MIENNLIDQVKERERRRRTRRGEDMGMVIMGKLPDTNHRRNIATGARHEIMATELNEVLHEKVG